MLKISNIKLRKSKENSRPYKYLNTIVYISPETKYIATNGFNIFGYDKRPIWNKLECSYVSEKAAKIEYLATVEFENLEFLDDLEFSLVEVKQKTRKVMENKKSNLWEAQQNKRNDFLSLVNLYVSSHAVYIDERKQKLKIRMDDTIVYNAVGASYFIPKKMTQFQAYRDFVGYINWFLSDKDSDLRKTYVIPTWLSSSINGETLSKLTQSEEFDDINWGKK